MGVQYDFQDTDAKVLKSTLKLNWTEPYKVLVVGPCSSAYTPDCSPLGAKLLYLDLPSDMPGANARRGVPVQRCKPCTNPHDRGGMPKYSSAGLTQHDGQNRIEGGIGGKKNFPEAGTAIDGGDSGRYTSDESHGGIRKGVNLHK